MYEAESTPKIEFSFRRIEFRFAVSSVVTGNQISFQGIDGFRFAVSQFRFVVSQYRIVETRSFCRRASFERIAEKNLVFFL